MFNPFDSGNQQSRPLPPRPAPLAGLQKIQQASAAALAAETPEVEHVAPLPHPTEQLEVVPQFKEETHVTEVQVDIQAADAANQAAADASLKAAAAAADDVATPDEAGEDDLPAKAGIIDYRSGEGLPSLATPEQAEALATKLDGLAISLTLPVTHKEPSTTKDGKPRFAKNGKPMMKKVKVLTNVSVLASGDENVGWAVDPEYAIKLIAEMMVHRVGGHFEAQGLSLKENQLFESSWLSRHFGTENLQQAIESELRPWSTTKVSTLSAATQAAMCSNITDAEEIITVYDYVEEHAVKFLDRVFKGKEGKEKAKIQLAPVSKAKAKYEQWIARAEKAVAAGKPMPKQLVVKSLSGETVKSIRAIAALLLKADETRQMMAAKFATGNYPDRYSADEVAEYISQSAEYSVNMQTVSCWLGQVATNMQTTEQRKLKKYSADTSVAGDDFYMI